MSDEDLERILRDPSQSFPELLVKPHRVEFVLVQVNDCPAEAVSRRIDAVVDIAFREGAFVRLHPPAVEVFFGAPATRNKPKGSRQSVVEALVRTIGSEVAIVHGARDAHAGLVGSRLMAYSVLLPDHRKLLGTLAAIPLGECREV